MRLPAALCLLLLPLPAGAADCHDLSFDGASYTLCEVTAQDDLRLFLDGPGPDGTPAPYGSFAALDSALGSAGLSLGFAMNAGMFHDDLSPVGLYVEAGVERAPLVTREGPGNFGLLPNGLFCIDPAPAEAAPPETAVADRPATDGSATGTVMTPAPPPPPRFAVFETRAFAAAGTTCRFATQSGPLLVIDGALHPRFLPDGSSLHYRNGVGATADGQRAVFAISNDPVNLHAFARLFRDRLGLPQALYLDGSVSRLYAPAIGRHDLGFPIGPIVGTVIPKD